MHRRVTVLLPALALVLSAPDSGQAFPLSVDQERCASAFVKRSTRVLGTYGKEAAKCVKEIVFERVIGADPAACVAADRKGKLARVRDKLDSDVTKHCGALPYPMACPPPCETTVEAGATSNVDDVGELRACLECLNPAMSWSGSESDELLEGVHAAILDGVTIATKSTDRDLGKCQARLVKAYEKIFAAKQRELVRCARTALGNPELAEAPVHCISDAESQQSVTTARNKLGKMIAGCPAVSPFDAGTCQGETGTSLGDCLDTVVECRFCRWAATVLGGELDCDTFDNGQADGTCEQPTSPTTTSTTTTTTIPICGDGVVNGADECDPPASGGGDPLCNDDCTLSTCGDGTIEAGEQCETDGDCAGGEACSACCTCLDETCPDRMDLTVHAGTGQLSTATEIDLGFTGISHNRDHLDEARLTLLLCSAAGSGPFACGASEVRGVDPAPGNCRCAGDNRTTCNEPYRFDLDDCGGTACVCYARPPEPGSHGNTPVCDLWRLDPEPAGSWDVDAGSGSLAVPTRWVRYLGDALSDPCPTCDGDDVANDGARNGTCRSGQNDGQPCDANAFDATFPAPGGGAYSYDCFPDAGKNLSGAGLRITPVMTTGSVSLAANVECGFPPFLVKSCPCGVCTGDQQLPCSSDADCMGFGTCSYRALGDPLPNQCDGSGVCDDVGAEEGECAEGPDDKFCDAVTRANGEGFIACTNNSDCFATNIGIAAGNCTLEQRRRCFLDPIDATGASSPTDPLLVTTYCVPGTSSRGVDAVYGLPGPVREKSQTSVVLRCSGNGAVYPGCL